MNWKCDEDTAQEVLQKALTNDATMEQIWFSIRWFADDMQLEKLENLD
jgi:hypothetical protein